MEQTSMKVDERTAQFIVLLAEFPDMMIIGLRRHDHESLEALIKAGHYENEYELSSIVTEVTAPASDDASTEQRYVVLCPPFKLGMLRSEQQALMVEFGLQHEGLRTLLAVGEEHAWLQKKFSLWSLGSVILPSEASKAGLPMFPGLRTVADVHRRLVTDVCGPQVQHPATVKEGDRFLATFAL